MEWREDMVRFFDFSRFHGKNPPSGSTIIRVNQLIKYWPEADMYKYGEFPDTLIFQKVYVSDDYKFPIHFENKKILDICDPDWLEGVSLVETCRAMDAVVTPTEALANYIRQFHSNVRVIPDRFDLSEIPKPKKHTGKATTVVWFGYSHNWGCLKPALRKIDELGLRLILISDDNPLTNYHIIYKNSEYRYVKYNTDTVYQEMQKADFAVLPDGNRPVDEFKSNNKTIRANLAGLPVAKTAEEVELYLEAKNRQDWFDSSYAILKKEYNVKNSVNEYKALIKSLKD